MKKIFTLTISIAVVAIGGLVAWAHGNQDEEPAPLKVLIIDGQNNHKWKLTTPVLREIFESAERFTVEVTTTPPKKTEEEKFEEEWAAWRPEFSQYDVVVSNYSGELWPKEVRESFVSYVRNGGGFIPVHAANNPFPLWLEYNEMIGVGGWFGRNEKSGPYVYYQEGKLVYDESPGKAGGHGPQHEFLIDNRAIGHPITQEMPDPWLHTKDELYDKMRGPAMNLIVLATAFSKETNRDEPMMMAINYGAGRVFHTTLGHDVYSMRCRGFFDTMIRGAEWVAEGEVHHPWSADFPTKTQTSPVLASE